ncbi:MAG: hypothetical protein LBH62_03740 [Nitrososphaerota archaeon]|jgi:hypothetical protein|nr:hypothetical protein [Nitrososphaerota archaeon]
MSVNDFEDGSKLDFRVDAVIGYMYEFIHPDHPLLVLRTELIGESSGWSSIQTFTLTYKSQSSPSYPSQIASSPENPISTFDDNPVPSTNFVLSTRFLLGII